MEAPADQFGTQPSFSSDTNRYYHDNTPASNFQGARHQTDHRCPYNFLGDQNDSSSYQMNGTPNHSNPLSGQKRTFSHPNGVGSASFAKLYVVGISRTSTEHDVKAVFGEYGHILEVVLLKDKKTGFQQECCFVKYATIEQAELAIGALHCQYTFPGASIMMKVRYADGERERLGNIAGQVHKLYVGCLNRQASRRDIEEIFSPFGIIEEIYVVRDRDEIKQNRGCAFIQFTCRNMALAAIQALNGTYMMGGCDQPLVVRFAEPKKPRLGDSRPSSHVNDTMNGHTVSNEVHQMKSVDSDCKSTIPTSNRSATTFDALVSADDTEPYIECDWSEHVSADGDLYYYNCVTCESRWEKPEEYALYEQELDNLEAQQQ